MERDVASTTLGRLRGVREGDVQVFRGVPYAAPPAGELRWRPPQPAQSWSGEREASVFGPIAPQAIGAGALARSGGRMSEDCLYLNVWTPAADNAGRPVIVFLHGGGMSSGSGSAPLLNGAGLAGRGDLVVVTLNYRLGTLGVLNAGERLGAASGETTANLALQDILAALAFVRREAAAFGGDPGNVTLAGQSSGAVATACLMASPAARGLFDKAILQSGGLERVIAPEDAAEVAQLILARLGDPSPEALRRLPLEAILEAQANAFRPRVLPPRGEFHPFYDGVILPEHPILAALGGRSAPVPLLAGTAAHEWRTFDANAPDEAFEELLLVERGRLLLGPREDPATVVSIYREERREEEATLVRRAIAAQMVGDRHFTASTELLARGHAAAGNRVYHYEIAWQSPTPRLGACHNICLPLVFGTLEVGAKLSGAGTEAQAMSAKVQDAWAAFARSGDPSTPALGRWPSYDPIGRRSLQLGAEARIIERHRAAQLGVWPPVYPWMPTEATL